MDELARIKQVAEDRHCFSRLVCSLCPDIFGHNLVKVGLLLGLFGGSNHQTSADRLHVRSDIHVLVVGDPGLGKSQMLRAVSQLSPRSVFVSANTTTATGLTVTVSKESGPSGKGNDVALEAGALVLADQGVCCLDEFDKIGCDYHCLLEAMEQQQVSIAKSGVVASLSSRCSVIAAANPVSGHYDASRTIAENLKMSSPLLSRFDLLFILQDKPEARHDRMLSNHVIRAHMATHDSMPPPQAGSTRFRPACEMEGDVSPLEQGIRDYFASGAVDIVPVDVMKKYVTYAREFVQPRLSGAAATVLQNLYLKIRERAQAENSIPITTRQLESLVRLAQARARIELRDRVSEADARDVVALMESSILQTFRTAHGTFDFSRRGMSLAKQAKSFIAELHRHADRRGSAIFELKDLRGVATRMNLNVTDFDGFVEMLNDQSFLLKKGPRLYQVQTHRSSMSQAF